MAQQGVFGEILHVEGAYIHNLEDYWSSYWNNWRMDYNRNNRGDIYATHGIGPACQLLNIHRGDRMKTLVAVDTKAVNGPALFLPVPDESDAYICSSIPVSHLRAKNRAHSGFHGWQQHSYLPVRGAGNIPPPDICWHIRQCRPVDTSGYTGVASLRYAG